MLRLARGAPVRDDAQHAGDPLEPAAVHWSPAACRPRQQAERLARPDALALPGQQTLPGNVRGPDDPQAPGSVRCSPGGGPWPRPGRPDPEARLQGSPEPVPRP